MSDSAEIQRDGISSYKVDNYGYLTPVNYSTIKSEWLWEPPELVSITEQVTSIEQWLTTHGLYY